MRNYYCRTLIFSDRFDMIFRRAVFDRLFLCGNNVGDGALDVPNLVAFSILCYPQNIRRIVSKCLTA